jgi:hypothetical protein
MIEFFIKFISEIIVSVFLCHTGRKCCVKPNLRTALIEIWFILNYF